MADDDDKAYRWETEYEKTWEILQEDESGSLQASVDDIVHRNKRRKLLQRTQADVQLGMMRHLYLILDMSAAMEDQDLKPTRLHSMLKLLERFVEEYFDQNPVSQMGVIVTKNKRAEKISELAGNLRKHIQKLQELKNKQCQGEPSLQNSLEVALQTLRHVPGHASREVLVIFGSLTTCDPGDIGDTLAALKGSNVRVSMIGLSADVRICRYLCVETAGRYDVIMDEQHFKDLLNTHVAPPPASGASESSLIKMGFPHQLLEAGQDQKPSMCMCHLDSRTESNFSTTGYFCPQCQAKYCELPVECKACGLTLVSAPHLARSYHHLFPLAAYREVDVKERLIASKRFCYACQKRFTETQGYECETCREVFCVDCDLFIHDTLHSCPACASNRRTQQQHT